MICRSLFVREGDDEMLLVKLFFKLLLIPVWLLLAAAGLIVKLAVNIYGIARGLAAFILSLLLLGTIICYQDWVQAAFLICLYLILFVLLFMGTAAEVIFEELRRKVVGFILSSPL